jgi:cytochrome c553
MISDGKHRRSSGNKMALLPRRWRRAIAIVGIALLVVPAAGLVFAWLGIYNVAASRGHWPITDWLLEFGMRRSVTMHAWPIEPPPLDDDNLVRLGAAHFHGGCAHCHGAPGVARNPIVLAMLPMPPDLGIVSERWRDRELFWIVKHGIKYTGMPAWPSLVRDDEVWAATAFLKRLPSLDAAGYRSLAMGDVELPQEGGRDIALGRTAEQATNACGRCHGADERGPHSNLVPILHGQPSAFLLAALRNYAQGTRESGIMQPIAADMAPEAMQRIADYYSKLTPPVQPPRTTVADVENGRAIVMDGVADMGIAPCIACHGPTALPAYPRLAGQQAAYLRGQLLLWRNGFNAKTDTGAIMAPIARQLTEKQVDDVSAFFEAYGDTPPELRVRP